MIEKRKLKEKKNLWTSSAIQKINITNKRLSQLFKIKKKTINSHISQNLFQKISSLKKKGTKMQYKKKPVLKTRKKFKKGTVLILLGLKFQGKKSILLKITKKGFLVISGPFGINGISLRRINPRFAIPTEIKIDLSNLKLGFLNDNYFDFLKKSNKIPSNYQKLKLISLHRVRQSVIDRKLKKEIKKNFFLKFYLKSKARIF